MVRASTRGARNARMGKAAVGMRGALEGDSCGSGREQVCALEFAGLDVQPAYYCRGLPRDGPKASTPFRSHG